MVYVFVFFLPTLYGIPVYPKIVLVNGEMIINHWILNKPDFQTNPTGCHEQVIAWLISYELLGLMLLISTTVIYTGDI